MVQSEAKNVLVFLRALYFLMLYLEVIFLTYCHVQLFVGYGT